MKEIKEMSPWRISLRLSCAAKISFISFISCVPLVASVLRPSAVGLFKSSVMTFCAFRVFCEP